MQNNMPLNPACLAPANIDADDDWRRLVSRLPFTCLRLTFIAAGPGWRLPKYVGGIVRGAFGKSLFAQGCHDGHDRCPPCIKPSGCSYAKLFSTPSPSSENQVHEEKEDHPHPLVLSSNCSEDGRTLTIRLNLFGDEACNLQGVAIAAAIDCARLGLGRHRICGELESIEVLDAAGVRWRLIRERQPSQALRLPRVEPSALRIRLCSPLRIFSHKRAILPNELTAHIFLRALMRRVSMLIRLHGRPGAMPAFHPWVERAATLRLVERKLDWCHEERYSRRQECSVSLGGMVGEFTLEGEAANLFWPLLKLGEITHVGKGTIHGLGEFQVA